MIIPDANLIIYAHNQADPDHAAALAWWKALLAGDVDVGIPIVVVLAFLRLTNSPSGERTNSVIHSNRHPTLSAWFGGAAVYARALRPEEMARLASLDRPAGAPLALECNEVHERR